MSFLTTALSGLAVLLEQGGWVMLALLALSLALYDRCFHLLFRLRACRRSLARVATVPEADTAALRLAQERLAAQYRRSLVAIAPMVAAAPLLGLLGTVIGMIQTFESLAARNAETTMQGLSEGISKALITTETGLAIAIPAAVILYIAQRQLDGAVRILVAWEGATIAGHPA